MGIRGTRAPEDLAPGRAGHARELASLSFNLNLPADFFLAIIRSYRLCA